MKEIKVGFNPDINWSKPTGIRLNNIDGNLSYNVRKLNGHTDVKSFVSAVVERGCSFCPATFKLAFEDAKRTYKNFVQFQFIAFDFDGRVSCDEIIHRANEYGIPVLFAYVPLDKVAPSGFRAVFLNDISISSLGVARIYYEALATIFPETDECSKELNRACIGGNKLLYFDESIPTINIESLIRNMCLYLKDNRGDTHYKKYLSKFCDATKVRLNQQNFPDIYSVFELNRHINEYTSVGKNSPSSIIILSGNGENLPLSSFIPDYSNIHYIVKLKHPEHSSDDLGPNNENNASNVGKSKFHLPYRSESIKDIESKCQLFREFVSNERLLNDNELFGLATTMNKIESGSKRFVDILRTNSYFSGNEKKYSDWSFYLCYTKSYPSRPCTSFCPYKSECSYDKNILTTVKPKRGSISVLANCDEQEARKSKGSLDDAVRDFTWKLETAFEADDRRIHVMNAPTAIGKSTIVRKFMANTSKRLLVAFPSNDLKNEQYARAISEGIKVVKSPSLLEFKDELPAKVWNQIERLYQDGKTHAVTYYIKEVIAKRDAEAQSIALLKDYLRDATEFYSSNYHAFTTHSRLFGLDYCTFGKYDNIIMDEDPILNCMIPSQIEITMSMMDEILSQIAPNSKLAQKINQAVKAARKTDFFELADIPYEKEYNDISVRVDISSFCKAKKFYSKKKSDENNLLESYKPEDSIIFFKPMRLKSNVKYIIMSATANQRICNYFFGGSRVVFYDCKRAKSVGTLNQYTEHTMSRSDIDANPGIIDRLVDSLGIQDVITFKKYNKGLAYFGKTTGIDFLKGKDLIIAGTPHYPPFIYKLIAYTLGLRVDMSANMSYRPVRHKGIQFWFMTFGDETLRNIQFWMIESELEQAVGRARLLREPCTVHLLSNFPIVEAEIKKFEFNKQVVIE